MPRTNKKNHHHKPKLSKDHADQKGGKRELYEIQTSPIMGRYLIASEDIQPGQLIIQEEPYIVGPSHNNSCVCIGCYKDLDNLSISNSRCPKCKWPICKKACSGNQNPLHHSLEECDFLSNIEESPSIQNLTPYSALVPLRCLMLRRTNSTAVPIFSSLEHHNTSQKLLPEVWKFYLEQVVKRIRESWGCSQYSEEEILNACGRLDVNTFAIENKKAKGLYPTAYLMSHDCVPNTNHVIGSDYVLKLRATRRINKGEPITISYTNTFKGTVERRAHLKEAKFFFCTCKRCCDPTELNCHFSAVKCKFCPIGYLYLETPFKEDSGWICHNTACSREVDSSYVSDFIKQIDEKLSKIANSDIDLLESFILDHKKVLHPNHFLIVSAEISLSQMYGKVAGYLISEMDTNELQRKLNLCTKILKTIDVFEPGYSRLRGVTLYEMHAPLMIISQMKYHSKEITKQQLGLRLKEVVRLLQETVNILGFEEPKSAEGCIALAAKEALKGAQSWKSLIGNF